MKGSSKISDYKIFVCLFVCLLQATLTRFIHSFDYLRTQYWSWGEGKKFQKLQNEPPTIKHERILKSKFLYILNIEHTNILNLENKLIHRFLLYSCACVCNLIQLNSHEITFLSQNRCQNFKSWKIFVIFPNCPLKSMIYVILKIPLIEGGHVFYPRTNTKGSNLAHNESQRGQQLICFQNITI